MNRHLMERKGLAWMGIAAAALALSGCAGPRSASRDPVAGPAGDFGPAYRALAREARREGTPSTWSGTLPPGLPPEVATALEPGGEAHAWAAAPLDEVLNELTAEPATTGTDPKPATERDRDAALRRYIAGRQKLLAGDVPGAAADLRAATRLDPDAAEPWRELAETQSAMGARAEAIASLGAAVARGLREPRALEFLGRAAQERSDHEGAARLFALAWKANPASADPGLPAIVLVGLGRTLLELDRLTAGQEAIELAILATERVSGPTRYPQEVGFIVRRRADLWTAIGDAHCRMDRFDEALSAFLEAAGLPAVDGTDLSARVVFAAVRAGRPAAAAVHVLERIAEADGAVTPADVEVLGALGRDPDVRRHSAAALRAFRLSRPEGTPASILGGLARAEAAAQSAERARETLLAHLRLHPADGEASEALFKVSPSAGKDAARLATEHPGLADRFAESLLKARPELEELIRELERGRDGPGAALIGGLMLARAGQLERAWTMLGTIGEGGGAGTAGMVARVRVAAATGRWTDAESLLHRLDAAAGPETRRARAHAQRAMQRFSAALETLRPLLPDAGREDLLTAAELGLTPESTPATPEEIEGWLRAALQSDPRSDHAYALLLSLHAPGGPAPDEARTAQTLRELRQAHPESRLLAILRGQEFIRRSFLSQAERELLALANDDPMDRDVVELLVSIWERPGPAGIDREAAERWMRERVSQRPWASHLTGGLARMLIGSDRGDEAEALLRRTLEAQPDAYLARILEELLRGTPGKAEDADRLALARLEPFPRPIDASLELAETYGRMERQADAVEAIRAGVPAGAELSVDQRRRLLLVAGAIALRATEGPDSPGRDEAVWLLDELVRRRIDFAAELHERRLVLLATTPEADAERLADAAAWAATRLPALGMAPYLRMAEALVNAGRANVAIQVIARAAAGKGATVDVLMEWVRLAAIAGEAEDVRAVIARAEESGQLAALVERLLADGPRDESTRRDPRGVVAYAIGAFCMSAGREAQAEAIYELALEYDPGHPWANNNLGYALADRGDRLDRAEELLERAHAVLPDDASVLDSLGWLRYRQGVLEDDVNGAEVKRLGALTLLERASQTPEGAVNPTIMDHYGDTLWALGRQEEARRAWAAAERSAVSRMRSLGNRDGSSTLRRELRELQRSTRSKLDAARFDREPPVTPPGERPAHRAGASDERASGGS